MTAIALRRLGSSELYVTPVGIGTAPIGSTPAWRVNWGPQDESEAIRAIQTAIDLGVNWIDTAPFYGWGRAEQIVGQAIRGWRDRVYLFTKCGTQPDGQGGWFESLKPQDIRREVEQSLQRLQTDHIDLYQFHDPDPRTPIEESWQAMQQLIREGKVRCGGLSNHPVDLIERAQSVGPVTANQHQYSMLHRNIEQDILPYVQAHGMGLLAWSPLSNGFLTDDFDPSSLTPGDFRRDHPYAREPARSRLRALCSTLSGIARQRGKTLVQVVLAWTVRDPALSGAIVGIRSVREAQARPGATGWTLEAGELQVIEDALRA